MKLIGLDEDVRLVWNGETYILMAYQRAEDDDPNDSCRWYCDLSSPCYDFTLPPRCFCEPFNSVFDEYYNKLLFIRKD